MSTSRGEDLALALRMADAADAITLARYQAQDLTITTKPDNTPVTDADKATERCIREILETERPDDGILGEEFGSDITGKNRYWVIDPIDGTMHFVRGNPFCTTMVVLIEDGEPIFSAIYDFVNDIMYHAEKGKGSFKDGERINVGDRPVEQSVVALETDQSKPINVEIRNKVRERSLLFQSISAGYEFVLVATGKIEARICFDPFGHDYDFAPGCLLVAEAGGIVNNIGSESYDFKNVNLIAGNKHLVENFTNKSFGIFPLDD